MTNDQNPRREDADGQEDGRNCNGATARSSAAAVQWHNVEYISNEEFGDSIISSGSDHVFSSIFSQISSNILWNIYNHVDNWRHYQISMKYISEKSATLSGDPDPIPPGPSWTGTHHLQWNIRCTRRIPRSVVAESDAESVAESVLVQCGQCWCCYWVHMSSWKHMKTWVH